MTPEDLNFTYKVRLALNERVDHLPTTTKQRLASARKLALSRKKSEPNLVVRQWRRAGNAITDRFETLISHPFSLLMPLGVAVPLVVGALVFVGTYKFEQQERITEIAEIDAAVLADDLPLSAYLDKGFNAYLASRDE